MKMIKELDGYAEMLIGDKDFEVIHTKVMEVCGLNTITLKPTQAKKGDKVKVIIVRED